MNKYTLNHLKAKPDQLAAGNPRWIGEAILIFPIVPPSLSLKNSYSFYLH